MSFSNEWNELYNKDLQLTSWPWTDLVSLISRYCKDSIEKKGVVLELGCGVGPNIPFIKSIGMEYYGLDGSKNVIKKLLLKFPELNERVFVGDFSSENAFKKLPKTDIIIDRAAVTHNDSKSIVRILENCLKKLKTGGYFIGVDWFSTKHSDFHLGSIANDSNTRFNIQSGQFKNVGLVHFSHEEHLRNLFSEFDILLLEEKVIKKLEPKNEHQFSSWNIVARRRFN
jgi:SAM-dependent methyltransferase